MFEYMGSFYINKETRSGNYALGLTVQGLGSGALSPEPYTVHGGISSAYPGFSAPRPKGTYYQ